VEGRQALVGWESRVEQAHAHVARRAGPRRFGQIEGGEEGIAGREHRQEAVQPDQRGERRRRASELASTVASVGAACAAKGERGGAACLESHHAWATQLERADARRAGNTQDRRREMHTHARERDRWGEPPTPTQSRPQTIGCIKAWVYVKTSKRESTPSINPFTSVVGRFASSFALHRHSSSLRLLSACMRPIIHVYPSSTSATARGNAKL
jgi:hypothetical protein